MRIKNKKIFITGGAGFIGTSLIEKLVKDNEIIIYDNLHRDAFSKTNLANFKNIKFMKGDILDFENIKKNIKSSNIIIHLAAIAGVDTVIENPVLTMQVNILGTFNILAAALLTKNTLEHMIDFSTSEVFGTHAYKVEELHLKPNFSVGEARWTYAVSKLTGEFLMHSYFIQHNIPITIVRPFNIYGPRQVGSGAIHHFILKALKNKDLVINGDGSQIRAWCYINDVLRAILLILDNKKAIGNVFNIGNPRSVATVYDLAQKIIKLSGSKSKIIFKPLNYVDVEIRIPNIDKAKNILKYAPQVDLEEGLIKTINWYKGQC
ncbi:MAG: GDP-mannose 4,6-dehydratase [Armatimonadetes bacterium]|nr:GDP-mannose 4,6-dehydratase [Armatimonadota bacterium]